MCGIAGVVSREPISNGVIKAMTDAIAHRGPDGEGHVDVWTGDWFVSLGHRRLAIIDLSERAKQPMAWAESGNVITYNGEVYNFKELRQEMEKDGYRFHSESDTEVVLSGYRRWGIIEGVKRLNGMFAFALWDDERKKLYFVRDRYGVKPLYYWLSGSKLIFGSEVKAILAAGVKAKVDVEALNEYFTFQNIFTDRTLFEGVKLLPPATIMEIDLNRDTIQPTFTRYWDCAAVTGDVIAPSEFHLADEVKSYFTKGVLRQLVSDVPVGSYLSGGMDTSAISVVAKSALGRICTFTCGFDLSSVSGMEMGYDERDYAESLANLIKSEQYESVLHAGDMEAVLSDLVWHIEDLRVGQCYPDWYACRLASKFVKVVLSGTGGDELFGGYPWRYYRNIGLADGFVKKCFEGWQRLVVEKDKEWFFTNSVYTQIKKSAYDVFSEKLLPIWDSIEVKDNAGMMRACMLFEFQTFLHGLLLVTDKISMAHSLETRVPFLDNDLVDFALRIPVSYKLKNIDGIKTFDENTLGKRKEYYKRTNDGKVILRQAMRSLLPREVLEREKQGFSAPDGSWFKGDSINYIRRLFCEEPARIYDYVNKPYVEQKLNEHMTGKVNHRLFIWSLLCFEHWLRRFMP